jgi:galactosylceramidase
MIKRTHVAVRAAALAAFALLSHDSLRADTTPPPVASEAQSPQATVVELNGSAGGDRFDGIGAVSGGGATTDLLKDYPAKQRNEILDLLFKPNFGASISGLYVEVPGDGNSTQGSEPSHMHSRNDENYYRGYEWWLMAEAERRNPALFIDACAWGCPGWIGNGQFGSQDMANYYVKWIKGAKTYHGVTVRAIGDRNEKGVDENFIKLLRRSLNASGLSAVKTHGFDNWGKDQWNWVKDLLTDPELAASVDVLGNHTITDNPTPDFVRQISSKLHKPIWNTEEHVYKDGFDSEITIVQKFNENYVDHGVTSIMNWYLESSVYPEESYPVQPAMLVANSPWSGAYTVRPTLWGFAHYGQFTKIGWKYLKGGCANLAGGGSYVTLKSPGRDYSIIAQTKDATQPQTVRFHVSGGLSDKALCVWRSTAEQQFVRLPDISPINGSFSVTLAPNAIYSLSTTRGQRKGSFSDSPAASSFPMPYYETFDHYSSAKNWGYLPHYTADIVGVFELAERPDHTGMCLKQVLNQKANSWAAEWMPYTVIGDAAWKDYEVSVDMLLANGGTAGIMGRVTQIGDGYHTQPTGYYMSLNASGQVELHSSVRYVTSAAGDLLASGKIADFDAASWHNLKLQFSGSHIAGFVDGVRVVEADSTTSDHGMAGLMTGGLGDVRNTAYFDNLIINTVDGPKPHPTVFPQDRNPIYR